MKQLENSEFLLSKALIVDLDGTVRRSKSGREFISDKNDIELIPGVEEKIWKYRMERWLVLGITNQGGVAYGYKTPEQVDEELDATVALFKKNPFVSIKSSLNHPLGNVEPYCHRSLVRKPDIGMLVIIESELWGYGIIPDWDNSLFVGDRPEDEECAKRAGIRFKHINDFLKEEPIFDVC